MEMVVEATFFGLVCSNAPTIPQTRELFKICSLLGLQKCTFKDFCVSKGKRPFKGNTCRKEALGPCRKEDLKFLTSLFVSFYNENVCGFTYYGPQKHLRCESWLLSMMDSCKVPEQF